MVTFAPQEAQEQAPQYWFMSRPISEPKTDTSKEQLLKGAGEALTGATNIAENFTEQNIKYEATQGLDTINQQAIDRLNTAKANPALIDKDANELPSAVKGLPKDLDQLDQARNQGKLSQTYVDMQKYQLAQQLRTRYAGHREFIDETFAKSNREDPANRVVTSLMGDINSLAAASQSKRNESRSLALDALRKGYPQADIMTNALMSGKMSDDAFRSYYFKNSSQEYQDKAEDLAIKRTEAQDKFAGQRGEEIMTDRLNKLATDTFYNHQMATPGLQTPAEQLEYHRKLSSGEIAPDDEVANQRATQIAQSKAQFLIEANRKMDEHDPGQLSYRQIIGDEKAKKLVEDSAARFDEVGKLFTDEKTGIGHAALTITKAQEADTKYHLFNPPPGSPDKDATARFLRVFAAIGRDAAPETINKLMQGALVNSNYDQVLQSYISGQNMAGVAQPDPGNPVTVGKTVTELAGNPAVNKLPKAQKAAAFNDSFNNIDILTSPKANITDKRNTSTQFFDPSNRNVLGHFDVDSQIKLWTRLTNDKVASEEHKLGGQYWENYSGWVKDTFGTQLFPEAIQTINKFGDQPDIQAKWDNDKHQFSVFSTVTKTGTGPAGTRNAEMPNPELRQVQSAVDNLNTGLASISGLSKYEGLDPNAYMLKLLVESGMNKGLVDKMTKAVVNSSKMGPQ